MRGSERRASASGADRPSARPFSRGAAGAIALLAVLLLSACGSSSSSTGTHATTSAAGPPGTARGSLSASASSGCATTVAGTLGEVARRIYRQAASGSDVGEAVHRVQGSAALNSALAAGDASAARTALQALLVNQIVRIEIVRDGHVFASAGSGPAIAPVRGAMPQSGASFVLSVQANDAYSQVTRQVTGAQVVLLNGSHAAITTVGASTPASPPRSGQMSVAGKRYQVFSLPGEVFPAGPLRIAILVPSAEIACPGSTGQARVETLGHVGERIYQEELHSAYTLATRDRVAHDPSFQRAVAAQDVAGTRAAIVSFFAAHIHVVRVRVMVPDGKGGERLLIDLGGRYVLAPVHRVLNSDGKLVGHFAMAIQDDAGYMKLARRFTGADVLMRAGSRQVMGTLYPGPASVPGRGEVSYRGRSYQAYSFTGEAFPAGPLRISLLIGA